MNINAMVFLHMFHGRDTPDEEMEDWGYDGPTLGPFKYVHTTYGNDVKFAMELEAYKAAFGDDDPYYYWDPQTNCNLVDGTLLVQQGCLEFNGKYYGDWSVFSAIIHDQKGHATTAKRKKLSPSAQALLDRMLDVIDRQASGKPDGPHSFYILSEEGNSLATVREFIRSFA